MNIKNCPNYLFSDNLMVNMKEFDPNLLEINKLSFKGAFSVNRTGNDEDFLYLFLDDLDGYIEKTMELNIKSLILKKHKNKEALKLK